MQGVSTQTKSVLDAVNAIQLTGSTLNRIMCFTIALSEVTKRQRKFYFDLQCPVRAVQLLRSSSD